MSCDDAGTRPVQRLEIFTGAGRRRVWDDDVKAAIVAESYSGHETVCAVARRHGLSHSQLFTWRRQMREKSEAANKPAVNSALHGRRNRPFIHTVGFASPGR